MTRKSAYFVLNTLPVAARTGLCCLALAVPNGSFAQSPDPELADFANSLPDDVLKRIKQRGVRYLPELSQWIFQISPDGIATPAAAELQRAQQKAVARAREITALLRYDLNGDGNLTDHEVQQQFPYLSVQERASLMLKILDGDDNADQTLSLEEILAIGRNTDAQLDSRANAQMLEAIMAFDYNGDGQVSLDEASAVIAAIDPAILEQAGTRRAPVPETVRCTAPKPQPESEVVFVSGYEGSALSTIAVSGQDTETSVATISIVEGTTPLYIFATAHDSIIWNFEGATERVQQVVVQPRTTEDGPGAAVAGIPKENLTFVDPNSCIGSIPYQVNDETENNLSPLSRYLERDFDLVMINYRIDNLRLSLIPANSDERRHRAYRTKTVFSIGERTYELSAAGMNLVGAEPPEDGMSTIREMMRFYPGGLVALPFEAVHATRVVSPYNVLPNQAGLLQLMAEGRIEYRAQGSYYYIKEPILRFPAELNGAHSVKFVLATGVSMPAGSPGHSRVVLEETGECVLGTTCR